jgi:hypothetical protein
MASHPGPKEHVDNTRTTVPRLGAGRRRSQSRGTFSDSLSDFEALNTVFDGIFLFWFLKNLS